MRSAYSSFEDFERDEMMSGGGIDEVLAKFAGDELDESGEAHPSSARGSSVRGRARCVDRSDE